jgi:hypothetical protein
MEAFRMTARAIGNRGTDRYPGINENDRELLDGAWRGAYSPAQIIS